MRTENKQGILILGAIIFGVIAVILGLLGYQQYSLFARGKELPQRITLAELAARGPGDNIHLEIADFQLAQNFVYESESDGGAWKRIWIAMEPRNAQQRDPVKVLLRHDGIRTIDEVNALEQQQPLRGILVNSIHSIDSDISADLRRYYPGLDLSTAFIFAPDWKYPKATIVYTFLGSATLCILLFLGCGVGAWLVTLQPSPASTSAWPPDDPAPESPSQLQ